MSGLSYGLPRYQVLVDELAYVKADRDRLQEELRVLRIEWMKLVATL